MEKIVRIKNNEPTPIQIENFAKGLAALHATPVQAPVITVPAVRDGLTIHSDGITYANSHGYKVLAESALYKIPFVGWPHQKMTESLGFIHNAQMPSWEWPTFFLKYRLEPEIQRIKRDPDLKADLLERVTKIETGLKEFLRHFSGNAAHEPSLLHGKLYSANVLFDADGETVWLVRPEGALYGDREYDIAFTEMYDQFGPLFYQTYDKYYPRTPYYELKKQMYNAVHFLRHFNNNDRDGGPYEAENRRGISAGFEAMETGAAIIPLTAYSSADDKRGRFGGKKANHADAVSQPFGVNQPLPGLNRHSDHDIDRMAESAADAAHKKTAETPVEFLPPHEQKLRRGDFARVEQDTEASVTGESIKEAGTNDHGFIHKKHDVNFFVTAQSSAVLLNANKASAPLLGHVAAVSSAFFPALLLLIPFVTFAVIVSSKRTHNRNISSSGRLSNGVSLRS